MSEYQQGKKAIVIGPKHMRELFGIAGLEMCADDFESVDKIFDRNDIGVVLIDHDSYINQLGWKQIQRLESAPFSILILDSSSMGAGYEQLQKLAEQAVGVKII